MNKQLIASKTGMVLLAASITGASVMTTVAVSAHPKSRYQEHDDVRTSTAKFYKFQEAAIQFYVPSGWKVEKGDKGSITVSKSEGPRSIAVGVTALGKDSANFKPEALFKLFSEGVFKDMKKNMGDSFKSGEPSQTTQNGISEVVQTFTGKDDGVEMQGMVFVLYTDNPVGVFAYGNKEVSPTLVTEIQLMLGSFKKLE